MASEFAYVKRVFPSKFHRKKHAFRRHYRAKRILIFMSLVKSSCALKHEL